GLARARSEGKRLGRLRPWRPLGGQACARSRSGLGSIPVRCNGLVALALSRTAPQRRRSAENFFQGGSPKTGHPISPPGPSHRQKSFLTKFPGVAPGRIFDFRAPSPQGGSHTPALTI